MIIDEEIEIVGNGKTINYYLNKGYDLKVNKKLFIKISDLIETSSLIVNCMCDVCGEINKIKYYNYIGNLNRNGIYRCNECSKLVRIESIKNLFKNTNEKEIINQKRMLTCDKKYGTKNPMQCDSIKNKCKKSNIERYGYENVMKNTQIRENLKKSIFEKYGVDHYSKTKDFKVKYRESCLEKYGVENSFQSEEIKDKIKKTNFEKYGVLNPIQNLQIFEKAQKNSYKLFNYKNTNFTYQGSYELDFLNFCFENKINISKGPSIQYLLDGKNRTYFSDFIIPEFNLICEIKSSWTYNKDFRENLAKKQFSEKNGFKFIFIVDKNYQKLKDYLNIS